MAPVASLTMEIEMHNELLANHEAERFLSITQLNQRYGLVEKSKAIYSHWIPELGFPRPVKFGHTSRWRLSELIKWEKSREESAAA